MDFKKIFIKEACPTKIGGQAVLEGIMMKGEDRTAVCVRLPDDSLYIRTEKLKPRGKAYKIPILRGVMIFVDSLVTGVRTLMYSAEILEGAEYDEEYAEEVDSIDTASSDTEQKALQEEQYSGSYEVDAEMLAEKAEAEMSDPHSVEKAEESEREAKIDAEDKSEEKGFEIEDGRFTLWLKKRFGEKAPMTFALVTSVVIALVFTVGVFIIAPTWVVNFFDNWVKSDVVLNLIEGVFRILLFVIYVVLISRMKDIRTVFRFHGAEHQCIHCFEGGHELTPENCEKYETLHPRCGTSFLMFVMVIALLLFSLLGWPNLIIRIASRLLLIPVIAGLSYELLRWAGSTDNWFVRILSIPGLLLQKLTTLKPDRKELQVAIAAMKAILVDPDTPVIEGKCDLNGELITEEKDKQESELEGA